MKFTYHCQEVKHTHLSLDHSPAFSVVLDPCYAPGYRNFNVCFLFCCALESSCLGVVKSELINGRVSIILMINEANNKVYIHIQF